MISITVLLRLAILSGVGLTDCWGSSEIEIEQPVGNRLIDGAASIAFGSIGPGASTSKSFTIRNIGTLPLTGLNATRGGSTSFAVGTISPTTLASGASLTFTVTFSSDSGLFGLRNGSLQIASNDGDENPFNIALSGMKVAPDIEIEQPAGTVLVNGSSTVDFGIAPAGTQITRNFLIRNQSSFDLTEIEASLTGSNPSDYSFVSMPPGAVPPNGTAAFAVRFRSRTPGSPSAVLRIASIDPDENPFDITLTGQAVGPEISLSQGRALTDGAATIDYGSVAMARPVIRNFTINNIGNVDLTGIGVAIDGSNAADFSVFAAPPGSLAARGSATFGLQFMAGAPGTRTAQLHIVSNDEDESPFDVQLMGLGLTPAEDWRLAYFSTTANADDAADEADPDGDGIVNLLEYGLGGDPTMAAAAFLPAVEINPATGRLELRFNRFPERVDITLTVEVADSMAGPWTSLARSTGGGAFTVITAGATVAESGTGASRLVVISDIYPDRSAGHPKRFMRLRVTRP